jgi:plasmid stability protein
MNASHLTVRNVPEELASALEQERRKRGKSLNQTVIDLLEQTLGVKGTRTNGLRRLAGTWTEAEHRTFMAGIREFEKVDQDLWK